MKYHSITKTILKLYCVLFPETVFELHARQFRSRDMYNTGDGSLQEVCEMRSRKITIRAVAFILCCLSLLPLLTGCEKDNYNYSRALRDTAWKYVQEEPDTFSSAIQGIKELYGKLKKEYAWWKIEIYLEDQKLYASYDDDEERYEIDQPDLKADILAVLKATKFKYIVAQSDFVAFHGPGKMVSFLKATSRALYYKETDDTSDIFEFVLTENMTFVPLDEGQYGTEPDSDSSLYVERFAECLYYVEKNW